MTREEMQKRLDELGEETKAIPCLDPATLDENTRGELFQRATKIHTEIQELLQELYSRK